MSNSGSKLKKSPFKNLIRKMSNLNREGDHSDRLAHEEDIEIFSSADHQGSLKKFHQTQIDDSYGKESVDESMVAKITGAKEVLKKARRDRLALFGGEQQEVNIMDLLQLFRESQDQRGRGNNNGGDFVPQMLMAMAQSGHDNEDSADDHDSANNFGEDNDEHDLSSHFSLMQIVNATNSRDRDQVAASNPFPVNRPGPSLGP